MARKIRERSESGVYHVMLRGINQVQLFYDTEDRVSFLQRLDRFRLAGSFTLYAYALMGNHVHLLLKEQADDLCLVVKRVTLSYSHWFNKKYDRRGYLFQGRFRSEPVNDDGYLLTVLRYIHHNPVKIGETIDSWTSYNDYLTSSELVDTDLVLSMLSANLCDARAQFARFHDLPSPTIPNTLTAEEPRKLSDAEAIEMIKEVASVMMCTQVASLDRPRRSEVIARLRDVGLTVRQISRLTGLSRGVVQGVKGTRVVQPGETTKP